MFIFLYNISFYTVFNLLFICQSIHSSLLSRLKNTYLYESTANLEILPQDYSIDDFQSNYTYPSIHIRADITEDLNKQNTEQTIFETYHLPEIKFRNVLKNKYVWRPTLDFTKGVPTLFAEVIEELESPGRLKEELIPESEIRPTLPDKTRSTTTEVTRTSSMINTTIILTTSRDITSTFSKTWRSYFPSILTPAPVWNTLAPTRSTTTEETAQTIFTKASERAYPNTQIYSSHFSYETTTTTISLDVNQYLTKESVILEPRMRYVLKKIILKPIWSYTPNMTGAIERAGNKTHTKRGVPRCYTCGLDTPGLSTPDCHDIFEGYDERKRQKMFKKRTKCKGPNDIGGCFKRYLDVGTTYNERGCRSKPPSRGKSYASKRLMLLEHLLHNVNDGCVASPHATLTPFSRSVSLFARYHVCVCSQRYCNGSTGKVYELPWILLIILWRQL